MSSESKSEAARINGAKSRGPLEMIGRQREINKQFKDMEDEDRLAWVFKRMSDTGNSLALLIRYEGSLNRSYDKAFKQLVLLQSHRQRHGKARQSLTCGHSGQSPMPLKFRKYETNPPYSTRHESTHRHFPPWKSNCRHHHRSTPAQELPEAVPLV
jgi:hypothetical protein